MKTVTTIIRGLNHIAPDVYATIDTPHWRGEVAQARRVFSQLSVSMGGGRNPYLLTTEEASTKLSHNSVQDEYRQVVMYLAADKSSGVANVCPYSTPECRRHCLGHTSGRMRFDAPQLAQKVRTHFLVSHPYEFALVLLAEMAHHAEKASRDGKRLVVRLNGTSDIPWERVTWLLRLGMDLGVDRYQDYTKWERRDTDSFYYVARSITEKHRVDDVRPGDVVVVDTPAKGDLPTVWNGMPVIDGDYEHGDLRFLDQNRPDAVVLLRFKGSRANMSVGGFVKSETVTKVGIYV